MSNTEKMLDIKDLSVIYKTDLETVYAVNGVSLSLEKGATLGLVGEYADASRNPEVIAPLDKLRDLMADSEAKGGKVAIQLRLKGRDLVGAISNETNLTTRRINIRKG